MRRTSLFVIFLSVFIDLIGFGIVLPLIPLYGETFGASGFMIGAILASYSLMQFFFVPVWGKWSDQIGRRPVILLSNLGSFGSYLLFAFASGLEGQTAVILLLVSRVFAGVFGANLSAASAYIADISTKEKRSKSMAVIGIAFGLGFILGPALGAISAKFFGLQGPGCVAAALCGFNFLFGLIVLGESRSKESGNAPQRPRFSQWKATLSDSKLGPLILLYFIATFAFTAFESAFSLYLNQTPEFAFELDQVGYLFAYAGIISAYVQGGAIGRLVKKYGEPRLVIASFLVLCIGMFLMPLAGSLPLLLVGLAFYAVGQGIHRTPLFGLISINSGSDEQGAVFGVAQGVASVARIIGPIFALMLYGFRSTLPFIISGVICIGAGLIALRYLGGEHHGYEHGKEKTDP